MITDEDWDWDNEEEEEEEGHEDGIGEESPDLYVGSDFMTPEEWQQQIDSDDELQQQQQQQQQPVHKDVPYTTKTILGLQTDKTGLPESEEKSRIDGIILEASKHSRFFKREQERDEEISRKGAELVRKFKNLQKKESIVLHQNKSLVDKFMTDTLQGFETFHTWIHVDMDSFYVSVELRDQPHLKGSPVAVGSTGMLSTSSYEARKFGVRAGMPGFIGKKLCPELVIIHPNFDKYKAVAVQTQEIFAQYDADFEALSLDEAHLDITSYLEDHPEKTAEEVAADIRHQIFEATQLTASAGIAPNKMLAKIGSDLNKPNNQFCMPFSKHDIRKFMETFSVRKIPGIGKVTEKLLSFIGCNQCKDLIEKSMFLPSLFKEKSWKFFLRASLGVGTWERSTIVHERKSVSAERTFRATSDIGFLKEKLMTLSNKVAKQLGKPGKETLAKIVGLKVKTQDFHVFTRSRSISVATRDASKIFTTVCQLYKEFEEISLRLIGVRLSGLQKQEHHGSGNIGKGLDWFLNKSIGSSSSTEYSNKNADGEASSASSSSGTVSMDDVVTLRCPICNQEISAMSETYAVHRLNVHLDSCCCRSNVCNSQKSFELFAGIPKEKEEDEGHKEEGQKQKIEKKPQKSVFTFTCPICENICVRGKTFEEANGLLNLHMDQCSTHFSAQKITESPPHKRPHHHHHHLKTTERSKKPKGSSGRNSKSASSTNPLFKYFRQGQSK